MDIRPIAVNDEILSLYRRYHGYKTCNKVTTYSFCVIENEKIVAHFAFNPPPPGLDKELTPGYSGIILACSRMVAVPKSERNLKHISKPLKLIMKKYIDRTRYPIIVTYSDSSLGHNGYTYQCAGFKKTREMKRPYYIDEKTGERFSMYYNGQLSIPLNCIKKNTILTRWEHWITSQENLGRFLMQNGWERKQQSGFWKSGNPKYKWVKVSNGK